MNYSRNKLRKLLIQSLENRYTMDGSAFDATYEPEAISCDIPVVEGDTAEIALFDASADAVAMSFMSFEGIDENIEVESTIEDVEIVKAYSIATLDGEVTTEYVEEAVFDDNNIDGNVPVMVICYTDDGAMTYTTVDDFGVKIELAEETDSSVVEKETDGLIYEVRTMTAESSEEDSEVVMFDIVEFDNEMVQRTDVPMEVTTTSFDPLPTWDSCDLNQDGKVSALDAILMFNFFNTYFQSFFASESAVAASSPASIFEMEEVDINGDSRFSPIDVLVVINDLNEVESGDALANSSLTILDGDVVDSSGDVLDTSASRIAGAMLTLGITTNVTSYLKDSTWDLSVDESGTVTATDGETEYVAEVAKDGQIMVNGLVTEWSLTSIDSIPSFTLTSTDNVVDGDWADSIDAALLELYEVEA